MGHSDPAITAKTYTHVIDDRGQEIVEKIGDALVFDANVSLTLAKPKETAATA